MQVLLIGIILTAKKRITFEELFGDQL
jgi:hypothetical protein